MEYLVNTIDGKQYTIIVNRDYTTVLSELLTSDSIFVYTNKHGGIIALHSKSVCSVLFSGVITEKENPKENKNDA